MATIINAPLKTIWALHMDSPNETIPDGWVVPMGQTLDLTQQDINPGGNYTCPNLLNKYLLWGDPSKSAGVNGTSVDDPSGAPGPNAVGGSMNVTLTESNLPPHTHTLNRQVLSIIESPGQPAYLINVRDAVTHTEVSNVSGSGTAFTIRVRFQSVIPIMRVKL